MIPFPFSVSHFPAIWVLLSPVKTFSCVLFLNPCDLRPSSKDSSHFLSLSSYPFSVLAPDSSFHWSGCCPITIIRTIIAIIIIIVVVFTWPTPHLMHPGGSLLSALSEAQRSLAPVILLQELHSHSQFEHSTQVTQVAQVTSNKVSVIELLSEVWDHIAWKVSFFVLQW